MSKAMFFGERGKQMKAHLDLSRSLGLRYQANESVLHQFNDFLDEKYPAKTTIRREMVKDFLDSRTGLTAWGKRNAVIYIRQFCRFLNQRGIACYIPDKTLTPKLSYKVRYCPVRVREVRAVMQAARKMQTQSPIIGESYAAMIGLIWSAGLRKSEAIKFNHADIDLERKTLYIRETKFKKSRVIPIRQSAANGLSRYLKLKEAAGLPARARDPFFTNHHGKRIHGASLMHTFRVLMRRYKQSKSSGKPITLPRLHDLRHAFATRTLEKFYKNSSKLPPQTYLAVLATYLGHGDLKYSQYYLHPDFELLLEASKKFEDKTAKKAA